MKKILALLLVLVMVFSLVACASKTETPATETKTEETATETTTEEKTEEPAAEEEKTEEPAAEEGKVYNVAYLVNGNLGDKSFFDSAEAGLAQLKADGRIDYVTIEMGGTDEDQPTWLSTLYDVSDHLRHLPDARLPEGSCHAISRPAVRHL